MIEGFEKKPGLFTAIGIGIGSMIGSGWLFSAYYAAQYIGPISFISWSIGAILALILAMLLAEIAAMLPEKALFTRLITISHSNSDFGFIIAISGWLSLILVIPTEASATVQYLSTIFPSFTNDLIINQRHTPLGTACIIMLVMLYTVLNFWGMKTFARVSNALAIFKIIIPVLTAIILLVASFHPSNFISQGIAPYGYAHIFSGVIRCGIFYTFYGFALVAMYIKDLENPQKNIPRALMISVLICFGIYSLLQLAFIGSLPPSLLDKGWAQLNFTSPFAQLLILLDLHLVSMWAIILYLDSALSPSGTAIISLNSAAGALTGMAEDHQSPAFFNKIDPVFHISRRSILFSTFICCFILLFFKNWKELMILVSIFQLFTSIAIPIAFIKLRYSQPNTPRLYRVKMGCFFSYAIYIVLSYFLVQIDLFSLVVALALYIVFFLAYSLNYYNFVLKKVYKAFCSSWSIFLYMALVCFCTYLSQQKMIENGSQFILCGLLFSINFWLMINQKNYNANDNKVIDYK